MKALGIGYGESTPAKGAGKGTQYLQMGKVPGFFPLLKTESNP
jgi:hypothetical protein